MLPTTKDLRGIEVQVQVLSSMLLPQFTYLSKEIRTQVYQED